MKCAQICVNWENTKALTLFYDIVIQGYWDSIQISEFKWFWQQIKVYRWKQLFSYSSGTSILSAVSGKLLVGEALFDLPYHLLHRGRSLNLPTYLWNIVHLKRKIPALPPTGLPLPCNMAQFSFSGSVGMSLWLL